MAEMSFGSIQPTDVSQGKVLQISDSADTPPIWVPLSEVVSDTGSGSVRLIVKKDALRILMNELADRFDMQYMTPDMQRELSDLAAKLEISTAETNRLGEANQRLLDRATAAEEQVERLTGWIDSMLEISRSRI